MHLGLPSSPKPLPEGSRHPHPFPMQRLQVGSPLASSHRLQPGRGRRPVTSWVARRRGGALARLSPLRPRPSPSRGACVVATGVVRLAGYSPACVRPNQKKIHPRGQVKEVTHQEVLKLAIGKGGRASRFGHLRVGLRRERRRVGTSSKSLF